MSFKHNTLSGCFIFTKLHFSSNEGGYHRPGYVSLLLIRVYCRAAAKFHALDPFLPGAGCLTRAEEGVSDGAEGFGFAGGAGLKGAGLLVIVPRDVEGVALSVAKPVNDGAAQAALLVDGLLERLRLAPVQPQVPTLRDVQRFLTGLQHFVGRGRRPRPARD